MNKPSSLTIAHMEQVAAEFRVWQERAAADPVRQEWERWQVAKRKESVAGLQEFRDQTDGASALAVDQIIGPAEAKGAWATVTPHTALEPGDRPTFPADLWLYIERLRGYSEEGNGHAVAVAREALVIAAQCFRDLLGALDAGNVYLAADRAAACADTVANGIAALHLPKADGRYEADGKRAETMRTPLVAMGKRAAELIRQYRADGWPKHGPCSAPSMAYSKLATAFNLSTCTPRPPDPKRAARKLTDTQRKQAQRALLAYLKDTPGEVDPRQ